jgi:hypothetical protein
MLEPITFAINKSTGDSTRLTRFKKGANKKALGEKSHQENGANLREGHKSD